MSLLHNILFMTFPVPAHMSRMLMSYHGRQLRVQSNIIVGELAHVRIIYTVELSALVYAETEEGDEVHDPEDDGLQVRGSEHRVKQSNGIEM
jgi:hypothetical protein